MTLCAVAILAAGLSTRLPQKLTATLWGKPLVWWAAETARQAAVGPVYIVTGEEKVAKAAGPLDGVIYNPWRAAGLSTSVKAAIAALIHTERIVFLPGDMPLVKPQTVHTVCKICHRGLAVPTRQGRRGNPVAIAKDAYPQALYIQGDAGLRTLFEKIPTTYIEVDDPGIHIDIDTPQDMAKLNQNPRRTYSHP